MFTSAQDQMSRFPIITDPDLEALHALSLMRECNIRHLPVTRRGELVGVVSERDLKWITKASLKKEIRVKDVMSSPVYTARWNTPLGEVVSAMAENKFGCAVIKNYHEQVIGIFTTTDALNLLSSFLKDDASAIKARPMEDYLNQLERIAV